MQHGSIDAIQAVSLSLYCHASRQCRCHSSTFQHAGWKCCTSPARCDQQVFLHLRLTYATFHVRFVMQDFYLSKHSGRRLVWHNSLGSCVMRAHFTKAAKELSVSLFQVSPSASGSACVPIIKLSNGTDCDGSRVQELLLVAIGHVFFISGMFGSMSQLCRADAKCRSAEGTPLNMTFALVVYVLNACNWKALAAGPHQALTQIRHRPG